MIDPTGALGANDSRRAKSNQKRDDRLKIDHESPTCRRQLFVRDFSGRRSNEPGAPRGEPCRCALACRLGSSLRLSRPRCAFPTSAVGSSVRLLEPFARFYHQAGWLAPRKSRSSSDHQGRDDIAMKKNVSHPGALPSRTSNSGDCKWGHFCPPSLAIRGLSS